MGQGDGGSVGGEFEQYAGVDDASVRHACWRGVARRGGLDDMGV